LKLILFLIISVLLSAKEPFIDNKTLDSIEKRYGIFAKERFISLQNLLNSLENKDELVKLSAINSFFNKVRYISDMKLYNRSDYWATPFEFLAKDGGDCEDFVISKYFALIYLGISSKKLFFTYVKSKKFSKPHMVLTYFKRSNSIPLVLDNYNKKVLPASKRDDLIPIYNLNIDELNKSKKLNELLIAIKRKKI